jgi:hypothetical protein
MASALLAPTAPPRAWSRLADRSGFRDAILRPEALKPGRKLEPKDHCVTILVGEEDTIACGARSDAPMPIPE